MLVPLFVLADDINATRDGKLNILGIHNTVFGESLPVEVASMRLVMQFETEPHDRGETRNVELRLLDARGEDLLPYPLQRIFVPHDYPAHMSRLQVIELNGVSFFDFGEYAFVVTVDDEERAHLRLRVLHRETPQEGG